MMFCSLNDEEIRDKIAAEGQQYIDQAFPGMRVSATTLQGALREADADFLVEKHPLLIVNDVNGMKNQDAAITECTSHVATVRTDSMTQLGIVGKDYGVVQTLEGMTALDILANRGDVKIVNVENVDNGARVRVTAIIGVTTFLSADGAPNTLCNFAVFEACHDGSACFTAAVYTLRLECFNGMTSRKVVKVHKLRHTSKVSGRVAKVTQDILTLLIGDVAAETEVFKSLVNKRMSTPEFLEFTTEFLGGELTADTSDTKKTRRANIVEELTKYFVGGNQGAGPTAWGAYNSVTRWIEAKREGIDDTKKAATKFTSNLEGDGQDKIAKALKMLHNL